MWVNYPIKVERDMVFNTSKIMISLWAHSRIMQQMAMAHITLMI